MNVDAMLTVAVNGKKDRNDAGIWQGFWNVDVLTVKRMEKISVNTSTFRKEGRKRPEVRGNLLLTGGVNIWSTLTED